jgi:hypothetical protein
MFSSNFGMMGSFSGNEALIYDTQKSDGHVLLGAWTLVDP